MTAKSAPCFVHSGWYQDSTPMTQNCSSLHSLSNTTSIYCRAVMRHAIAPSQMNKLIFLALVLILILSACGQIKYKTLPADNGQIQITWNNKLSGDYSFTKNWSYPEGVYKNTFGQLSCDGLCPERTYSMKDSTGRIYPNSLRSFYQLVDTTHQNHSIQCEAWCYEWAGTNFINAIHSNGDSIKCITLTNSATHCSLHLILTDNICIPIIELNSIAEIDKIVYICKDGYINIDRKLWKKGTLKTEFSFNFLHPENPSIPMFWKGRAFVKIENK